MSGFVLPPDARIDSEDVWNQVLRRPSAGTPALVVDRDGVLVEEIEYLHEPDRTVLIPGAAETVAAANAAGLAVVVVTNQAGIARGYYGWPEFLATQDRMRELLAAQGARIDAVYACPHHKDGAPPYRHPSHPARKPNPGMLLRAKEQLDLDMAASWIVGDRASDLAAGRAAGLAGGLHVTTGHGAEDTEVAKAAAEARDRFRVVLGSGIADALTLPIFG